MTQIIILQKTAYYKHKNIYILLSSMPCMNRNDAQNKRKHYLTRCLIAFPRTLVLNLISSMWSTQQRIDSPQNPPLHSAKTILQTTHRLGLHDRDIDSFTVCIRVLVLKQMYIITHSRECSLLHNGWLKSAAHMQGRPSAGPERIR